MKFGWLGQPKGMKQILWERGLLMAGMKKSEMQMVLSNLPDFRNEKIGIRNLLESRGHILVVSPKCHPEIAGNGIEYCWGLAEIYFKNIISKNAKNIEKFIAEVLSTDVLTMERVWKYERKTRDYHRLYHTMAKNIGNGLPKYEKIEEMRKFQKTLRRHRHICDTERQYIAQN